MPRSFTPRIVAVFVVTIVLTAIVSMTNPLVLFSRQAADQPVRPDVKTPPSRFDLRIGVEQLRNPYWYAAHGQEAEAKQFWDKGYWERVLKEWADDGYNGLLYWVEPWTETSWQAFLIRHKKFPEARELTPKEADHVIEHVNWIFHKAHELGIKNFLFTYQIATSTKTGSVRIADTTSRRVMSRSSGSSSSPAWAIIGSSAIPHFGQVPGESCTISGCIGQVYFAPD